MDKIGIRASGYSTNGATVDGKDFAAAAEAMEAASERAPPGDSPSLFGNIAYRMRRHSRQDRNRYRTKIEISERMGKYPFIRFAGFLVERDIQSSAEVEAIEEDIDLEFAKGIEFANTSPTR